MLSSALHFKETGQPSCFVCLSEKKLAQISVCTRSIPTCFGGVGCCLCSWIKDGSAEAIEKRVLMFYFYRLEESNQQTSDWKFTVFKKGLGVKLNWDLKRFLCLSLRYQSLSTASGPLNLELVTASHHEYNMSTTKEINRCLCPFTIQFNKP